ncbi:hypothetical protein AYO20_04665 [Fonsecaea nubica]|uniref:Uncharacterized protein n=1 Tax=Fonsecaea nubica TaxID=856822 RepID=A0A178D3R0_9EURO|nr:hypothetical protein AYO20_04665 [Fonsecaea nubica]OAL36004.1 hypothetical protein AYO20_04665 [Fonsecaea nubica]
MLTTFFCRGPVKGYIDVLEGRLYELESALLQALPLVSDDQLNQVTASIPPIPNRRHFRNRFSQQSSSDFTTPPPFDVGFHQPQQESHPRHHQQPSSRIILPAGSDLSSSPVWSNSEYLRQVMCDSPHHQQQHHQHHLPPLELATFLQDSWLSLPALKLAGDSIAHQQDQSPVISAQSQRFDGEGGRGGNAQFDFLPDF